MLIYVNRHRDTYFFTGGGNQISVENTREPQTPCITKL